MAIKEITSLRMSDVEKSADRLFEHTVEEAILMRSNKNVDIITEETRKSSTVFYQQQITYYFTPKKPISKLHKVTHCFL